MFDFSLLLPVKLSILIFFASFLVSVILYFSLLSLRETKLEAIQKRGHMNLHKRISKWIKSDNFCYFKVGKATILGSDTEKYFCSNVRKINNLHLWCTNILFVDCS